MGDREKQAKRPKDGDRGSLAEQGGWILGDSPLIPPENKVSGPVSMVLCLSPQMSQMLPPTGKMGPF